MEVLQIGIYIKKSNMIIKFRDVEIYSPDENDYLMKYLSQTRNYYELNLLNKIKEMNLKGIYIDVGANIGNHTIFFSKETPAEFIHSFEICDATCDILKINLTNNNIKNVKVHNYGLSDNFRPVQLLQVDKNNLGSICVVEGQGDSRVVDLDKLGLDNISLIKIDVEGHELNVIRGAKETIKNHSPVIIAELHTKEKYDEFLKELPTEYKCDGINYAHSPTYIFTKLKK